MEYLGAVVAMVKILAVVVLFILVIYSIAVENDPKRKLSEVVTCIAIVTIIAGMQTLLPKLLSGSNKTLVDALTNWDPSALIGNQNT